MTNQLAQSQKAAVLNPNGAFKGFQVGYVAGDRAGLILYYTEAKTSRSARHTEDEVKLFDVVTTQEKHTSESLGAKFNKSNVAADCFILSEAQRALKEFIDKNGETNPRSALDWEGAEVYVPPGRAPTVA